MTDPDDLGAIARSIVDSNRFMTLATADGDGTPWASPVWYAPVEYREFLWVSSPEARTRGTSPSGPNWRS
jgi:predicted pyridoxine 5'-phosphate oxidase superfamily flavin-nucleotide-binding protein